MSVERVGTVIPVDTVDVIGRYNRYIDFSNLFPGADRLPATLPESAGELATPAIEGDVILKGEALPKPPAQEVFIDRKAAAAARKAYDLRLAQAARQVTQHIKAGTSELEALEMVLDTVTVRGRGANRMISGSLRNDPRAVNFLTEVARDAWQKFGQVFEGVVDVWEDVVEVTAPKLLPKVLSKVIPGLGIASTLYDLYALVSKKYPPRFNPTAFYNPNPLEYQYPKTRPRPVAVPAPGPDEVVVTAPRTKPRSMPKLPGLPGEVTLDFPDGAPRASPRSPPRGAPSDRPGDNPFPLGAAFPSDADFADPLTPPKTPGVDSPGKECKCKPEKKKKAKPKPRTICYQGTYTEHDFGLSKIRRKQIPCQSSKKTLHLPRVPRVPSLPGAPSKLPGLGKLSQLVSFSR
jgi:hypothetical protein